MWLKRAAVKWFRRPSAQAFHVLWLRRATMTRLILEEPRPLFDRSSARPLLRKPIGGARDSRCPIVCHQSSGEPQDSRHSTTQNELDLRSVGRRLRRDVFRNSCVAMVGFAKRAAPLDPPDATRTRRRFPMCHGRERGRDDDKTIGPRTSNRPDACSNARSDA